MTDLRKAAEMALEALSKVMLTSDKGVACENAKKALRQALAQPEQEPFIYVREDNEKPFGGYEHCSEADVGAFPVYTAPVDAVNMSQERVDETAKRKHEWVGLTDEEIDDWFFQRLKQAGAGWSLDDVIRAVQAKLKEKNT